MNMNTKKLSMDLKLLLRYELLRTFFARTSIFNDFWSVSEPLVDSNFMQCFKFSDKLKKYMYEKLQIVFLIISRQLPTNFTKTS